MRTPLSFSSGHLLAAALAVVSAAACGSAELKLTVDLYPPCDDGNIFKDVKYAQFVTRVAADAAPLVTPQTAEKLRGGGAAPLPKLTAGSDGSIEARLFETRTPSANEPEAIRGATGSLERLAGDGPLSVGLFATRRGTFAHTTDGTASSIALATPRCSEMVAAMGRAGHTATTLQDGRVLIVGGAKWDAGANIDLATISNTAEIFDPYTGLFTELPAKLTNPRVFHSATLLSSTGQVLIAGGLSNLGGKLSGLRTAELFDPSSNSFTNLGAMARLDDTDSGRAGHTAVEDHSGRVFIAGGFGLKDGVRKYIKSTEFYDIGDRRFDAGNPMSEARAFHTATRLPCTRAVFIAGGTNGTDALATVEILEESGAANATDELKKPTAFCGSRMNCEYRDAMNEKHAYHTAELVLGPAQNATMPVDCQTNPEAEYIVIAGGLKTHRELPAAPMAADLSTEAEVFAVNRLNFPARTQVRGAAGSCSAVYGTTGRQEILRVGGVTSGGTNANQAELLTLTFSGSTPQLAAKQDSQRVTFEPRAFAACALMQTGMVLVSGGWAAAASAASPTWRNAEVYNP